MNKETYLEHLGYGLKCVPGPNIGYDIPCFANGGAAFFRYV